MNRWTRTLVIGMGLSLLPLAVTFAQDSPPPEETPEATPEATPEVRDPTQPPNERVSNTEELLLNARYDLNTLVSALNIAYPFGWSGSADSQDPQLPIYIRLDLELLAGTLLGAENRPVGWFGVVPSSAYYIARDIRHDLELLADAVLPGQPRPSGWLGGAPILRCDRATQALVSFLERNGVFTLSVNPAATDYCAQAANAASVFVELNYLESLAGVVMTDTGFIGMASINSDFAVGFYDRSAAQRAGVIPNGTPIQPLGRSTAQYSNMMLAQGENFVVFVDYQFTSVSAEDFRALPNADEITAELHCEAEWCEQ